MYSFLMPHFPFLYCLSSVSCYENEVERTSHLRDRVDEGNDYVLPLDAFEDVSDYWEDSPQPKHLHILVQKLSGMPQNTS